MKSELLKYLRCPICKKTLSIEKIDLIKDGEIIDGALTCKCGSNFFIKSGIPNMIIKTSSDTKKLVSSYDKKWEKFDYEKDYTYGLSPQKRVLNFLKNFDIKPKNLKGKTVFDGGCGNGRLACNIAKYGCHVIAMDLSSIVKKAFRNCKANTIHYIQGDLNNIPFEKNSFDFVWCHGVLMNVNKPHETFNILADLVKTNGKLYTMFYSSEQKNLYNKIRLITWKIISKLPNFLQNYLCYLFTLILVIVKTLRHNNLSSNLVRESKGQYYEMFTTPYNHIYSQEEIIKWFKNKNFKDLKIKKITSGFSFIVCGTKE